MIGKTIKEILDQKRLPKEEELFPIRPFDSSKNELSQIIKGFNSHLLKGNPKKRLMFNSALRKSEDDKHLLQVVGIKNSFLESPSKKQESSSEDEPKGNPKSNQNVPIKVSMLHQKANLASFNSSKPIARNSEIFLKCSSTQIDQKQKEVMKERMRREKMSIVIGAKPILIKIEGNNQRKGNSKGHLEETEQRASGFLAKVEKGSIKPVKNSVSLHFSTKNQKAKENESQRISSKQSNIRDGRFLFKRHSSIQRKAVHHYDSLCKKASQNPRVRTEGVKELSVDSESPFLKNETSGFEEKESFGFNRQETNENEFRFGSLGNSKEFLTESINNSVFLPSEKKKKRRSASPSQKNKRKKPKSSHSDKPMVPMTGSKYLVSIHLFWEQWWFHLFLRSAGQFSANLKVGNSCKG